MFRCGVNRAMGQSLRCVNGASAAKKSLSSAAGRSLNTRFAANLKTATPTTAPNARPVFSSLSASSPMSRLALASVERCRCSGP